MKLLLTLLLAGVCTAMDQPQSRTNNAVSE